MAAMLKSAQSVRAYTGPVKACILDWSGTTADKYVLAPALAFLGVFSKYKVPITMSEARGPMGLRKDFHIKALTEVPTIRQRWRDVHGKDPDQTDIDKMVRDFIPMQLSTLRNYTELIPGVADTVKRLKSENNIKFGCTTGFYKSMVDILLEESKKQGYEPDCSVAGDEVYNGARPKPFMIYRNLDLLDVHPIQAVVKVDDTVSGIGEAIQAGCWGVGVARYSNYMDIDSLDQEAQLLPEEIESRLEKTREILHESGAHYVIDSLADLPEVIEDINVKMSNGVSP